MKRFGRIGWILVALCLLLSACQKAEQPETGAAAPAGGQSAAQSGEAAPPGEEPAASADRTTWDIAFETGNGVLEEISLYSLLLPADYSGFTIGFLPGQENQMLISGDPVHTGEDSTAYYALTEEAAKQIFVLPREIRYTDGVSTNIYQGEGDRHPQVLYRNPDGSVLWYGPMTADSDGRFTNMLYVQRDREITVISGNADDRAPFSETGVPGSVTSLLDGDLLYAPECSADGRYLFINRESRWRSGGYLDLPWLLDTRTWEIVPLFTPEGLDQRIPTEEEPDHRFCGIQAGCFSLDGRYLYMILWGNLPEWGGETNCRMLTRYDLQTGKMEECCRLDNKAESLFEPEKDMLLVYAYSRKAYMIRTDGAEFVPEEIAWPNYSLYNIKIVNNLSGAPVVLAWFSRLNYNGISVLRNQPEGENDWYLIQNCPVADTFTSMNPEELGSFLTADYEQISKLDGSVVSGTCCLINTFIPVSSTPYVLIEYTGRSPYKESWTIFWDMDYRSMILNTETMEMKPIRWETERQADAAEISDSDTILMAGNRQFRLIPDASGEPEDSQAAEPDPRAQEKRERWEKENREDVSERLSILGDDYGYAYETGDSGELICTNRSFRSSGFQVDNDIDVTENGFRITVWMTMNVTPETIEPEYLVPPALTEERWEELKEQVQAVRKVNWKKISAMYTKVTPDQLDSLENADELTALFPTIREQTLYVLKDGGRKDRQRDTGQILLQSGYTREDYDRDMQLVDMEYLAQHTEYPIVYTFRADTPVRWVHGPAGALLTLADRLGSTIYRRYAAADPKPESVESLALDGQYQFCGIPYRVTLDSATEEGEIITAVFTAVPEDEWGLFPAEE